jgi:hypothetical protein
MLDTVQLYAQKFGGIEVTISRSAMLVVGLVFGLALTTGCHGNPYDGMGPLTTKDPNAPGSAQVTSTTSDMKVNSHDLKASANEGTELKERITVQSVHFPQGPFRLFIDGFPSGTTVQVISGTDFEIDFTPGYDFVIGQGTRDIQSKIHVLDPDNNDLDATVNWTIRRVRVAPLIVGPTQVLQSPAVNFTLLAEDLNGETYPIWSVVSTGVLGNLQGFST